jgi:hypothetical protein
MTQYFFKIGTYAAGVAAITNVESLTVPVTPPKSTFSPYAELRKMGDGSQRGVGAPIASWKWAVLPQTMRDQLRVFCLGSSADVFIRTYTKDNAHAPRTYQAVMNWPVLEEEYDATRRIGFEIKFTELVVPPTIFSAQINGGETTGDTTITFNNVTTGAYTDIAAGQTCLVGSAPGLSDNGLVLTVSASSTVLTVAANSIVWPNDYYLTVVP